MNVALPQAIIDCMPLHSLDESGPGIAQVALLASWTFLGSHQDSCKDGHSIRSAGSVGKLFLRFRALGVSGSSATKTHGKGDEIREHMSRQTVAQFIAVCRRSKWSKHFTNSPPLALLVMVGSSAARKISSACSKAFC